MKRFVALTMLSVIIPTMSMVQADPVVSGDVISWTGDDWYQVQLVNDDGIVSVCDGGSFCKVSQGRYIVINHSTGERFTDIVVNTRLPPPGEKIIVNGSVISWPKDGWYQVQDSTTYESICNGLDACDVQPGNYVVINHTTGERFDNIVVEIENNPISVTGNIISWPDNGWYQVQTQSYTHENICNGGKSCRVPNGIYTVINHSTGDRYRNIQVSVANLRDGEIVFSEIADGDLAFTSDLTFNLPRYQVIRSNEALNTLYYGSLTPPCPACDVAFFNLNFVDSTVVLVAHEIVNSGGYGIRMENAVVGGGKLTVNVLKTSPGQNCPVDDAFTGPFVLYKIDGVHDQIEFFERTVQDAACD